MDYKKVGKKGNMGWKAWKRLAGAAAVLMVGAMAAGCGKQQGATTAQKEFVYVPEYMELQTEDSLDKVKVSGDMIYFVSGSWDDATDSYRQYLGKMKAGETTPEKVPIEVGPDESMMASSLKDDGSLLAVVATNLYEETAPISGGSGEEGSTEEDGNAGEGESTEEENDADDKAENRAEGETGGENEKENEKESEKETEATAEEGKDGKAGSEGTESESVKEEGSVAYFSVGTASTETSAGGEYREPAGLKLELWRIGADGKVSDKIDLEALTDELDSSYVQYLEEDKDGNIFVGYEQNIFVLDREGEKLFDLKLDNWLNSMFATSDGQVLVSYWSDGLEVHTIDVAGKKMGDSLDALREAGRYGNLTFSQGAGMDLLFSANNCLYSYNFGDEKPGQLLNWIDCDIDEGNLQSFTVLEDGRVLAITSNWDGESGSQQVELAYLVKKKGSEVPEKKLLTYGTLMMDYNLRKRILEFNRTNQEYRIEVKEYYTGIGEEDAYTNALQQMNADIVSGKCPDIIDVSNGNMQSYVAKGVVEDLYPFMEKDEGINREDYLENVLRAYEKNGKLYALPPDFYITTVMAKVSEVGEKRHITLEEIMEIAKDLPEGKELYQYASKSSVLGKILRMNMEVFVDWDTGKCSFDSEDFIRALEFSDTFPKEFNWDEERPSVPTMIREGKLMMMDVSISSMQEFQMYKGMYGEPVAFVGYPTSKESGSCIISNGSLLAMSAKSPYQDGVWQFIRSGITKEAQEKNSDFRYGFPIMKSALEKQLAEDMEEEYHEGPDGEKIKMPKTTWGYDDFEIEIYAATEEEVKAVKDLIESTDTYYQYDMQMYEIIMEEAEPYFEGQKSAKEVADIIQSRIQIYVNENR